MAKILIAGGSGMIGTRLSEVLTQQGHQVIHLSRTAAPEATYPRYQWDLGRGIIDPAALEQVDYIINLAGTGIADKPWTKARKKLIIDSRTQSNALIKKAIEEGKVQPKAYLASAGIGIYGDRGDELLSEDSPLGNKGFLPESCKAWEASIRSVALTGVRTIAFRIGLVLSTKGGALPKFTMSLPAGLAPYFGNGQYWYSWIHMDDVVGMFLHAIENEAVEGFYNGVAPNPVRNKDMMKQIVKEKKAKAVLVPTPTLGLRIAMGELADVVLTGSKVSPNKIQSTGFSFKYPDLSGALRALFTQGAA